MESSEDDAGAATNASRRESAREKDIGGSERCSASGEMLQEGGAASETTSMSEETFDADSVPSPSQELNTSTEAILDMIDEIVDGPSAPKRRSRASADNDADERCAAAAPADPDTPDPPDPLDPEPPVNTESTKQLQTPSPSTSANSENVSETVNVQVTESASHESVAGDVCSENTTQESEPQESSAQLHKDEIKTIEMSQGLSKMQSECIMNSSAVGCEEAVKSSQQNEQPSESPPQGEVLPDDGNSENVFNNPTLSQDTCQSAAKALAQESDLIRPTDSPQASSSVASAETAESTSGDSAVIEEFQSPNLPSNIPSSSVVETTQNISDSSENQNCERTIKCVTSSDKRDNVTVESAESTSSESTVTEGRSEATMRSPLRRRLVRPAPSERRPDSTVSSTVDSQTVTVHTTEQTTSESVTKDVSSSSDAVASVYANVKPEEIRNVSEISVCKAETSMNPPKKIKLVRHKVAASTAPKDFILEKPLKASESEQCQSTSSECTPSATPDLVSSNETQKSNESGADLSNQYSSNDPAIPSQENITEDRLEKPNEVTPNESQCSSKQITESETSKPSEDYEKKVPPIKLNLSMPSETPTSEIKLDILEKECAESSSTDVQESTDSKQIPKLTIKLGNKQSEEMKSPIPKLTIKPIRPPSESERESKECDEHIPSVTKINIKPIPKPAEKINDIHRKSSSSEISESESSENDESNSTSDPASNSDQGSSDIVPKVTIKVGKPGTESEGKFYTEQNVPKLLIKGIHSNDNEEQETGSKLKLVISQAEEKQPEKIPKLTIKTVQKSEIQPLSPKLTIKPLKPPENKNDESSKSTELQPIPKLKISTDAYSSNTDIKENTHIPKITIKPVVKTDTDSSAKTPKKSTVVCDSPEHIPVVTKLNIKPILKPSECALSESLEERIPMVSKLHIKPIVKPNDSGESSEELETQVPVISKLNIKPVLRPVESEDMSKTAEESVPIISRLNIKPIVKPPKLGIETGETSEGIEDKVPVVSKINIKPLIKPKDNEIESSLDNIPKVTKLNIKPLRNPEEKSSEEKDCDDLNTDTEESSIPVVTKLNIKPIVKPVDEDMSKDSENQSSETGNSSDDNNDHIPVVTKINIKPILKPNEAEDSAKPNSSSEEGIPVVTKLNIKPLIKPEESKSPSSPKRDSLKITKLNIKPVLKPEEIDQQKLKNENEEIKNPPLVMKINIKSVTDFATNEAMSCDSNTKPNNIDDKEHTLNNLDENIPKVNKLNIKPILKPNEESAPGISAEKLQAQVNCKVNTRSVQTEKGQVNCVSNLLVELKQPNEDKEVQSIKPQRQSPSLKSSLDNAVPGPGSNISDKVKLSDAGISSFTGNTLSQITIKPQSSLQNCTLLKKLLETKKDGLDKRLEESRTNHLQTAQAETIIDKVISSNQQHGAGKGNVDIEAKPCKEPNHEQVLDLSLDKHATREDFRRDSGVNITKPLEISISDKISNQSSGQDSPRIIIKINKTDHGPSAKIITEEIKRPETPQNDVSDNTQDIVNDKQNQKKVVNSRKKTVLDTPNVPMGKRLRSSRIVENTEISPVKRSLGKRASATETSPVQNKEPELSVLESKRLKLGQLLSGKSMGNASSPPKACELSPIKTDVEPKQTGKLVNHSIINNENCSKNGNSKLHNILSNLQAKQAQSLAFNDVNNLEKVSVTPELESNTSTGSSDVVEIIPIENLKTHPEVQQMLINENAESHEFTAASDMSQDPLDTDTSLSRPPEPVEPVPETPSLPPVVEMTPQPKKRGRPRKLPASEPAKPVVLPTPALEERPQRSLRLSRDQSRQPAILAKPRGRGRGRGARRVELEPREEPVVETANKFLDEQRPEDIDPTSSRIKLPRMTEALDKMPAACTTPLSSRGSAGIFDSEPKVVLDLLPKMEEVTKPPETPTRGGRGSRGGRGRGRAPGRTPRGARGRGRGGGRGAMYMKETMGIYGRVCGPATTTVQLFEEETCMMDDNATPAKPLHLLDEDSQSSVKSSTNDSSRQKSKFAELFDSNKIWTAADVKEYMWPPSEAPDVERQVMMIQEQVAMFLGVKSFKRRYPELKRRTITAEERDYVLGKGLVTEALCDLGITAVDASEVLDIMLSDYPHKYEEYRAHQRQRQLAEPAEELEVKFEPKPDKIEIKVEAKPVETKPEPPRIDLEKSRQEAMAAAIASASEWNARLNSARAGACVDLQTHAVHRRRPPRPAPAAPHVCPPAGFYPHALLPGQYQHFYRHYTPDQLRYFPLNTAWAAPPAPPSPAPSDSDSDDWRSSSSSDRSISDRPAAKRKKLTKTKRSSQNEPGTSKEKEKEDKSGAGASGTEDTCRTCGLRLEANRKYTHERFLVCATCNAKLHPGCVELSADTIRAARQYAWQCAQCKACCACAPSAAAPAPSTAAPAPAPAPAPRADQDKLLFCDLCDRGFHCYCVGLPSMPSGRWHCAECAICKSCGARSPSGAGAPAGGPSPPGGPEEAQWHHQTRRGPGGHKIYSHSLCTPCARAYRIGRYCPLCERSFIGPKGTMQLVICKLCDRQHHQECVRQTTAALRVLDYTCGECRRGGITSRAAAARLAPRTIATLFMAKRRFNKYAHRQYLESRQRKAEPEPEPPDDSCEPPPDAADPLEGAPDEAAAAVAALRMDFGD